jgi:hypothetical protein
VLAGATVTEVAAAAGVSRSTLHRWIGRYLAGNVAGLTDRSHRPACPGGGPLDIVGGLWHRPFVVNGGFLARAQARRRWDADQGRTQLRRSPSG